MLQPTRTAPCKMLVKIGISSCPSRRAMRIAASAAALTLLTGCASTTVTAPGPAAAGDERGGKIAYAGNMPGASSAVRAHCEQFGKKGFITQMNLSPEGGGTIVFECR